MMNFLRQLFRRGRMSEAWIRDQVISEGQQGWEGPRWRTPKELSEMRSDG